jgi:4a-hydroxytetrahydrobiopterin dehydratase
MASEVLGADEIAAALNGLNPGWTVDGQTIRRRVEFPKFMTAVRFIDELAPLAEALDHHPDLGLSWRTVEITLSTHSAGGLTSLDLELARQLDPLIDRLLAA